MSPLAEGRELKWQSADTTRKFAVSPLAEGRELKYIIVCLQISHSRVAPRGGA